MTELKEYLKPEDIEYFLANTPQVTFEVTDACNLKCEYCGYGKFYNDYDDRKNTMLSVNKAKIFLEYILGLAKSELNNSTHRNIYISFYGGEPLMNMVFIKEVVNYLDYIDLPTRTFTFNMTTNAILLAKYMDYLVEHDFKLLISLDGDKYNTSYRVDHKGGNAYDKIVRNINLLRDKYTKYFEECVSFNAVLHNRNSVEQIHSYFRQNYNKTASIGELNNSGIRSEMQEEFFRTYKSSTESLFQSENYSEIERDMFLQSPTYHSATVFLLQYSDFKYSNYNELLFGKTDKEPEIPTGTCLPFTKKVYITVNGKILPCERISHEFDLGVITEDKIQLDFAAIANQYNEYYNKMKPQCKSCHNKRACTQCVFNLSDINERKPQCYGFMSKKDFEMYKQAQYAFLSRKPEAYSKIMNEVIVK